MANLYELFFLINPDKGGLYCAIKLVVNNKKGYDILFTCFLKFLLLFLPLAAIAKYIYLDDVRYDVSVLRLQLAGQLKDVLHQASN